MVEQLHSLEQSIAQLQTGLIAEQQRSTTLETKCETLDTALISEQQNSQALESMYQSLETKCESLQQITESLESRCEYLESSISESSMSISVSSMSISAEQENVKSLNLEAKWAIARDEISFTDETLGTGGWGFVKEATFRGQRVAAKCLHDVIISQHNQELFAKEMKIYAQCHHKNLVEFIGAVPDHPAIIVIEMMDCTLRSALADGTATTHHIHPICIDVAEGLVYLHSIQPHPVIHRDVSAPNVLLKAVGTGWIAKLSDLGSAQFANKARSLAPGCVLYAAPEVQEFDTALSQTEKVDVYSYGVLLIEILTREMPTGTIAQLISSLIPIWPQFISSIQRCTNTDPIRRPTMREVIASLNKITV